ncbi:MAG: C-terminal target protein [Hymenobacter sp.]|nr:C-terminal target protein [Hymenobacter sp.]
MQQLLHGELPARPVKTLLLTRWGRLLAVLAVLLSGSGAWAQSSANYVFSTGTAGSLLLDRNSNAVDMSTGTTQLVGADLDNSNGIGLQTLPISFTFMGTSFTQFSASSNGLLRLGPTVVAAGTYTVSTGTAASPIISAFGGDLRTGSTGKVHYKTVGTAPNRTLVVEFLNMSLLYVGSPGSNDGTYQVRLYESTGAVEFVYGAMFRNAGTSALNSQQVGIGFAAGSTVGKLAYILSATNANTNTSATFTQQTYTVNTAIASLNSAADGSRRTYTYVPTPPATPTALTFTGVTGTGMTVGFTDNSPTETRFLLQYSTDNVTFTTPTGGTITSTTSAGTGTAYSLALTGLTTGTTYYYRVVAIAEGPSSALTGSQATTAGTPRTVTALTYTQNGANTYRGQSSQQVTGLNVNTAGTSGSALTLNSLTFDLGSTNPADITNARLYSTGTSATFATTTLVPTTGTIASSYTLTVTTPAALPTGDNYFWLTYDIAAAATPGNTVASVPSAVNVSGTSYTGSSTPAITPGGAAASRLIIAPLSGTYYVTATVGSSPDPAKEFATLTAAANAYTLRGVGAATSFVLLDAAYSTAETFPITFGAASGASATNTLTIKPGVGVTTTVTNATTASTFKTLSASYVILDGSNTAGTTTRNLTLSNTSASATAAALVWVASTLAAPSTGVQVLNLTLQGAANGSSNTSAGVMISNTTYNAATGGSATGTVVRNNAMQGTSFGIVEGNDATAPGTVQIVNNLVGPATAATATNLSVYGIFVYSVTSPQITGNTVRNVVNSGNYAYGIYLGPSTGSVVDGNRISGIVGNGSAGYGGFGIVVATGTTNANGRVSNNFVYAISGTGYTGLTSGAIVGILLDGSTAQSGINVYYNSVYLSGSYTPGTTTTGLITAALGVTTGNTGLDVRNNVFANALASSSGTSKSYALYSAAAASAYTTINYNDYYVSGTQGVLAYLSSDRTTLTALRTATTQDGSSLNIDPQFTSTTDLHTSNSALAVGTPLGSVTTDIDGDLRSTTAPFLGADETLPLNVDAQPTALVAPAAGSGCYSSAEAVTVTVRNASTIAALDFVANPVTVTVVVTGTNPQTLTQTFSTNAANPGGTPLAVGATVNLTLTGTQNMSTAGTYTFAVSAAAQGDQNTANANLATQTRTVTAPALTSISASTASICGASGPVTLTATGVVGGTVTFYSSVDNYTAAIGTGSPLAVTATATTSYRANVVCNSTTSANSNVVTVTVNNPTVTSTNAAPASICGTGTSTITAGGSAGTTVRLYSAATGGTLLATGTTGAGTISYTTPTIAASTSYYAEASSLGGTESVGRTAPTGTTSPGVTGYGLTFDATSSFVLKSVDVYNNGAATNLTIEVQTSSSTVISGLTATVAIPAGTGTTAFTVPLNFTVPVGTGMKIIGQAGSGTLVRETGITFPFTSPGGSAKITGAATGAATNYYFFYNWQISGQCTGARTAIPVTVTPAPTLTPASTTQTVCVGSSTTITFAGYPTLSVTPTAGTVVTGQDITFTPPLGTTTYTVTGTDGTCSNTATVTLNSNTLAGGTATATSAPFCNGSGGAPTLAVSNLVGQTSFVWQASATGAAGSFAPLAGSDNQSPYTAPAITATTYYQVVATCGSTSATSTVVAVAVSSPSVAATNSPITRCGAGTVALTASGSTGSTSYYYAAASGGQPLGSGASYTATVTATPATQNFYVAARDNASTTYVAGLPNSAAAYGTFAPAGGTANRTLGFDVSQSGTLASVDVYPSATGSVNILIYAATANPGATGALLATVASPAFTAAQVGTRVTVPLGIALVAGSYKLSSPAATLGRFSAYSGTYPLTSGALAIVGSYNSATTATYTAGTYNNFFNVTFAASCESARSAITVNVTTPPTLTYTGSTTICPANSTVLTFAPASYTALVVAPTTGTVVDNAAHTITFSPTASTSYTVTGNDGTGPAGCTATAAVAITVNAAPTAPTLTPTAATICAGNSATATAAATYAVPAIALTATFNSGGDGFTTTNSNAANYGFARYIDATGPDSTPYIEANAYSSPNNGTNVVTTLVSPTIDLTGYSAAKVKFSNGYYYSFSDNYAQVQISGNNGSTWTTLKDYYTDGADALVADSLVIPNTFLGLSTVKVRFNYSAVAYYGGIWDVDNVVVRGTKNLAATTYAVVGNPATASVSGSTITFNPLATTTYQVTATGSSGCPSPATPITITVNTVTAWTGATSTDWFTSSNWTNCVPTRYTDATVPVATSGNYPSISTTANAAEVKSLTLDSGASLSESAGTLNIYASLTTNGTTSLTGGMVAFLGASPMLTGSNPPAFYNLNVNLNSGTLTLGSPTTVTNALTLTAGTLTTGSYSVILPAGATISETDASYVLGTVSVPGRSLTAGTAENFGGIGLVLTPAAGSLAPGPTPVVRTTGTTLTGVGTSKSIQRYFDIQPATNTGLDVTMDFTYLAHENTNGINASKMTLFKSTTGAGGPWAAQRPATINGNTVTKTGITDFSVWTLGDADSPLPVQLVRFEATRQGAEALLDWATATELDNQGFEVQVSLDGQRFRALGFVAGAGSSASPRSYRFTDRETGKAGLRYYRLRQVDRQGTATFSPVRTVLFEAPAAQLVAWPNPYQQAVHLSVTLPLAASSATLTLIDGVGREVLRQELGALPAGLSEPALETTAFSRLPVGVYVLRLSTPTGVQLLKLTKE